jgi:hypothetical protein
MISETILESRHKTGVESLHLIWFVLSVLLQIYELWFPLWYLQALLDHYDLPQKMMTGFMKNETFHGESPVKNKCNKMICTYYINITLDFIQLFLQTKRESVSSATFATTTHVVENPSIYSVAYLSERTGCISMQFPNFIQIQLI